jgi:TPR repeat protein
MSWQHLWGDGMTRRGRKRRALRRALVGTMLATCIALLGTQIALGANGQSCSTSHGTVAAASAQQFDTLVSAAQAGNTDAMVEVGYMYRDGLGVERNLVRAHAWLSFAAYKGAPVGVSRREVSACMSPEEIRLSDAQFFSFLQREEED